MVSLRSSCRVAGRRHLRLEVVLDPRAGLSVSLQGVASQMASLRNVSSELTIRKVGLFTGVQGFSKYPVEVFSCLGVELACHGFVYLLLVKQSLASSKGEE